MSDAGHATDNRAAKEPRIAWGSVSVPAKWVRYSDGTWQLRPWWEAR